MVDLTDKTTHFQKLQPFFHSKSRTSLLDETSSLESVNDCETSEQLRAVEQELHKRRVNQRNKSGNRKRNRDSLDREDRDRENRYRKSRPRESRDPDEDRDRENRYRKSRPRENRNPDEDTDREKDDIYYPKHQKFGRNSREEEEKQKRDQHSYKRDRHVSDSGRDKDRHRDDDDGHKSDHKDDYDRRQIKSSDPHDTRREIDTYDARNLIGQSQENRKESSEDSRATHASGEKRLDPSHVKNRLSRPRFSSGVQISQVQEATTISPLSSNYRGSNYDPNYEAKKARFGKNFDPNYKANKEARLRNKFGKNYLNKAERKRLNL